MNKNNVEVVRKNPKKYIYFVLPLLFILLFACSFLITVFSLNSESFEEEVNIYAIDKITLSNETAYEIEYYPVNEDKENVTPIKEEIEIDEFLEPESENIAISYFKEINKRDNSFLNWIFHYDNNIYTERYYYITDIDKLKLEENGTTDILDLEDIIAMDEDGE